MKRKRRLKIVVAAVQVLIQAGTSSSLINRKKSRSRPLIKGCPGEPPGIGGVKIAVSEDAL